MSTCQKIRSSFKVLAVASGAFAAVALPAAAAAQSVEVPELRRTFPTVQAALDAIGDREGTVLLTPGVYRQCAVQTRGLVAFRATQPGRVIFDGVTCEGKAALVLRGQGALVDGIVFQNMHVPDLNGAGIRLEQSDLTVSNSLFRDSDEGILSGADPDAHVQIDQSTFSRLGRNDGGPSHSIYVGDFASVTVLRSRFERGTGGHYVKSRAARIDIRDCTFDDTLGRESNYMIDLPAGATGRISGNYFVQGQNKENYSAFIAVAAEARDHSSAGLAIEGNQALLAPGVDRRTVFVANWSRDTLAIGDNRLGSGLTTYERR